METTGFYLLRSAAWLTGFTLVFMLFLRNERFFVLNRIYLIVGILSSVILPLFTVRYVVTVPALQEGVTAGQVTGFLHDGDSWQPVMALVFGAVWLTGVAVILLRYVTQVWHVLRAAGKADRSPGYPVRVIRSPEYPGSFSLFSFVVVNPSVSETETREIMNHEMVHIRQMHWFDLVLSSLLCAVQWFNPAAWIYSRFIRQNHEYLADEEALQRTSDPAVYRAVLINQIAGSPVIDLGNFFSYSLNKKRFIMMKNTFSSPYRKLRLLLILPVAALLLYAFAEPQYRVAGAGPGPSDASVADAAGTKSVTGVIKSEKGNPLEGAVIVIKGTTVGTVSDATGRYSLKDVPDDAVLVVSYVGFVTKAVKVSAAGSNIDITLQKGTMVIDTVNVGSAPPPPPPPPPPPASAGKAAAPGKDVSKEGPVKDANKEVFVVVEEMPQFPGGDQAMMSWIAQNVKYPSEAAKKGIMGMVMVSFVVDKTGKVGDVKIKRGVDPALDAEAARVVALMPDWKPGSQRGNTVDVECVIPVKFSLK